MMKIADNMVDLFKFTYSWAMRKEDQKLFGFLALVGFLCGIGMLIAALLMFGAMFAPAIASLSGIKGTGLVTLTAGLGIAGIILGLLLMIFIALVFAYYNMLPIFSALRAKGLETVPWTWRKFVGYLALWIAVFVADMFSLLNKKWIPLVVVFYLLIMLSFIFPILWLLTILVGVPYIFLVIYNTFRLSVAIPIYLSKGLGITDSLKNSWDLTQGNVLAILAFSFCINLVWAIVMWILGTMFGFGFQIGVISGARMGNLGVVLMLIAVVLYVLFRLLEQIFNSFTGSYLSVGIYEKLLREKGMSPTGSGSGTAPPGVTIKPEDLKKLRPRRT